MMTLSEKTVRVPAGYVGRVVNDTEVIIDQAGKVWWENRHIGYVWKGARTYSPPTHKGSRIVRYHKRVAEWHGHPERGEGSKPRWREDTRQRVLQRMIAAAMED